jgi:hypothetical protein
VRSRLALATAAVAAAGLLAGCRGDAVPATGEAAASYFPMVPGAHWRYELQTELGGLELDVVARGSMPVRGREGLVFVMEEKNEGPDFGFVRTAPVGYVVEEGFVARFAGVDYVGDDELLLLGRDEPTRVLPLEPEVGQSWDQHHSMFATPEGGGGKMGWSARVESLASLRVPAGTFRDVVVIHSTYTNESEYEHGPATRVFYEDYYARGVGLVRSVTRDTEGGSERVVEQVLLEYRFPAP